MTKTAAKEETEMVVKPTTALSTDVVDFGEDAGAGYEGISGSDLKIPLLKVLQSGSPYVKTKGERYVEGARESMIFLSIPEHLWDGDEGALFVPAVVEKVFIEQLPYGEGGGKGKGFRGIRAASDPEVIQAISDWKRSPEGRKKPLANYPSNNGSGSLFVETYQIFGIAVDLVDGILEPIGAFSFGAKGKAIAPFRTWLTTINQYRHRGPRGLQEVPLFAHLVRMTTHFESNEAGEFYVPHMTPANKAVKDSLIPMDSELYRMAKKLRAVVSAGQIDSASYDDSDTSNSHDHDDTPAEDLPF